MCLVHLFVCFVRVIFCHFSLPHGVGRWLRFVIEALPGLFYLTFFFTLVCLKNKNRIRKGGKCLSGMHYGQHKLRDSFNVPHG